MAKPNPNDLVTNHTESGTTWSCKRCGKGALTPDAHAAATAFGKHNCS